MKALTITLSLLILGTFIVLVGCSEQRSMHAMDSDMKTMVPQETAMETMKKDTMDMNKSSMDPTADEKMGMDKPMKDHTM